MKNAPLYNSRIIRTYVEYLLKYYPDIDIDSVLVYAGITSFEMQDGAHWFNQSQVDRFHEMVALKTANPKLPGMPGVFQHPPKGWAPQNSIPWA